MSMRLNRYLALCGLASRRACETIIQEGRVRVNGRRIENLATVVEPGDQVTVDGNPVESAKSLTLILHKPPGVVSSKVDPKGRQTLYNLLPPEYRNLHYVGRLDTDSEGLIVMTNDGSLTHKLTQPAGKVAKEYLVTLDHPCRSEGHAKLKQGIPLEEGLARAVAVYPLSPKRMVIVLQQGLNRQIRRMFESMELKVVRLVRTRIGSLELGTLKPGRWRVLRPDEIAKLGAAAGQKAKTGGPKPPRPRPIEDEDDDED